MPGPYAGNPLTGRRKEHTPVQSLPLYLARFRQRDGHGAETADRVAGPDFLLLQPTYPVLELGATRRQMAPNLLR